MTRRYAAEPVEVVPDATGAPQAFRWRRRRYVVCAVLAHWVEAVPWWRDRAGESGQHRCWRVEAVCSSSCSSSQTGVYDLSVSGAGSSVRWVLDRVLD